MKMFKPSSVLGLGQVGMLFVWMVSLNSSMLCSTACAQNTVQEIEIVPLGDSPALVDPLESLQSKIDSLTTALEEANQKISANKAMMRGFSLQLRNELNAEQLSKLLLLANMLQLDQDGDLTKAYPPNFPEGVAPTQVLKHLPKQVPLPSGTLVQGHFDNDSGGFAGVTIGGGGAEGRPQKAGGDFATIVGGVENEASLMATVNGGARNQASGMASSVTGGFQNEASKPFSTVGGGAMCKASGEFSTVPGGRENEARADLSIAAGHRAKALHRGSIVLTDSQNGDTVSTEEDQFCLRAKGGVIIHQHADMPPSIIVAPNSKSWSYRAVPKKKTPLDSLSVLKQVARLPIYGYEQAGSQTKRVGPTAEHFNQRFHPGQAPDYIDSAQADGVAIAAAQGLYQMVKAKEQRISKLEDEVLQLKRRLGMPAIKVSRLDVFSEASSTATPRASVESSAVAKIGGALPKAKSASSLSRRATFSSPTRISTKGKRLLPRPSDPMRP